MRSFHRRKKSSRGVRSALPRRSFDRPGARRRELRLESLERRDLLTGLLQGTAFIDQGGTGVLSTTDAYLPGATVTLFQQGNPTPLATAVTDPNGQYLFSGLSAGNYHLVETPPPGYVNAAGQVLSEVNPATVGGVGSIDVTLLDPSTLSASIDTLSIPAQPQDTFYVNIFGHSTDVNGATLATAAFQGPYSVNGGPVQLMLSTDIVDFLTFSGVDTFPVLPGDQIPPFGPDSGTIPVAATPQQQNAGRIAYLMNHYGTQNLAQTDAVALQMAVFKLTCDTTDDFSTGNFVVLGPYLFPGETDGTARQTQLTAEVARAKQYIDESAGKNETALFLDATKGGTVSSYTPSPPDNGGLQSLVATGSLNFANVALASVAGTVYNDFNANGTFDGAAIDPIISGATVALSGTDFLGQAVNLTTTTDANGAYSFPSLNPSNAAGYTLSVSPPAGYLADAANAGTVGGNADGTTSAAGSTPQTISSIVLHGGDSGLAYNFGEVSSASARVSGTVYNDTNVNGVFDGTPADQIISGATVVLTGADYLGRAVHATATTDANGAYSFSGLLPSNPSGYTLSVSTPAGYLADAASAGTVGGNANGTVSAAGVSPQTVSSIVLHGGDSGLAYNFGEVAPANIAGTVYNDFNDNGKFDGVATDPGISGATVALNGTDFLGRPVNLTTMTDANGAYAFTGLNPSNAAGYTLSVSNPAGYLADGVSAGTVGGNADGTASAAGVSPQTVSSVVLHAGDGGVNYNFGENSLAAVNEGLNGVGLSLSGHERSELTNVAVATFTSSYAQQVASAYSASIDWGDGATSSGSVTGANGDFTVSGSHTYGDEGAYNIFVNVNDARSSATVKTNAVMSEELLPGGIVGTADQRFISEVYRDVLNRAVEQQGLNFWVGLLQQGYSRAQVVMEILKSPEYRVDLVDAVFQNYLGRAPETQALDYYIGLVAAGATPEQLAAAVASSPEYSAAHSDNMAYVEALYADALHRAADPSGESYYLNLITQGRSRANIAELVFASPEYQRELVTGFYEQYLDREPDAGGLTAFVAQIENGWTDATAMSTMIGSSEYYAKTS